MPPTADGADVPVPGDGADGSGTSNVSQLPWQSIPKFIPGQTNVQEYVRKMKFLASMWPPESLHLLAPRAALLVEGSAFTLVSRLDGAKLRVNSQDGVALLVKTIGGQWGSTELEERFEHFERALYTTVQKQDESNDSFISRMENHFSELIARGTTMEEVQAYVLLRQSSLGSEDKKRILFEHGGDLRYHPVVKTLRMIGSKFFHEFQGKPASKTKVFDSLLAEDAAEGSSEHPAESTAFVSSHSGHPEDDHEVEPEYFEALLSQNDPDAQLIASFENEFEEYIQETPELHSALTSYVEARARLLDKRKTRGFWPPSGGKNGKRPFKGKGKGKGKGGRQNLLAKIARSTCRNLRTARPLEG